MLTGNVADGVSFATEAGHQHLVVLLDEGEATVAWHERRNFLAVFDELNSDALADGRVGLLRLHPAAKQTHIRVS